MVLNTRIRLSLLIRMAVSLAVIAAVTATIVLLAAAVIGGMVAVGLAGVTYLAWMLLSPFVGDAVLGLWSGLSPSQIIAGMLIVGLGLLPVAYLGPVRDEIREFRADLGSTGQPAIERHPKIAAMAGRLAQQAGIPEPTVRIVTRKRPESYALGGRSDGKIVITRGVVRQLEDEEIAAVLAHEIAHLANGDGRLMNVLLVPLLLAEHVRPTERPKFELIHAWSGMIFVYVGRLCVWTVVTAVTTVQLWGCQLGVGLLSRGREFAADRAAAELVGSPSSMASALEKLDGTRGRPSEDLRNHTRSAGALDILPLHDDERLSRPFRTHPSTERRVQRLQALVGEIET